MLILPQLIFYFASTVLLAAAFMVVFARNPVHSAMSLVLCFLSAAMLWMLLEAEFLSLVLIFVYVGAVMTLFLFVIMMLNVKFEARIKRLGVYGVGGAVVVGLLLFCLLSLLSKGGLAAGHYALPLSHVAGYSHTQAIGSVLYTRYVLPFELAAVLLLLAIVAAIALTFQGRRQGTKRQNMAEQVQVTKASRLSIVSMPSEAP